ncbi:prolipoprotein diacylglyceryl transferase [Pendulispora albinea]|uniref:Prolipoprotein diacylglyceryl transferase n=1 Tax=Pendulispora albinea TaxID=2741071 RepID=A0ABZ2M5B5_9BACT
MRPILVMWLAAHGVPGWLAPDYATMCGVATLLGAIVALRLAARDGASIPTQARALALAYLAALLGGYVFEWVRAIPGALAAGSWDPILTSGRAAYGGLLAGIAVPAIYLRVRSGAGEPSPWMPARAFLDRATPGMGFAFALVRIGCFLEGCDYGRPTSSLLGVRFPAGSIAADEHALRGWIPLGVPSLPVHATELYESLVGVAASLYAWRWLRRVNPEHPERSTRDGGAFLAWMAIYASGRFLLELLRGDEDRGVYLGWSSAQIVSIALLAATFALSRRWKLATFGPRALHRDRTGRVMGAGRTALLAFFLASAAMPRPAHAQGADAIVLRTGERVPGTITEVSPGDHVSIRLASGQVSTIPWMVITRLERNGRAETLSAPPPPSAPPSPASPSPPSANPPSANPPSANAPSPASSSPVPAPKAPQRSVQHARHITLQISVAPALTLARPDVPSGATSELDVLYRLRLGDQARLDVGLEGRLYGNDVAWHYGLGVPFQFALEAGRHFEVRGIFVPTHTWLVWDTKAFANVNVWALRMGAEVAWAVSSHVTFGLSPIGFNVISAESVGVITTYEPRLSFGLVF